MRRKYGFFTAIAMIVGIVIGSGIFFKSDNVLAATGGRLWLGVLLFCIAATGIIFGALSVAELAKRSKKDGGVVAYTEQYYSRKLACGFGWFQTFMYFPALQAVISWVVGVYMCMLFPIPSTLPNQIMIGIGVLIVLYVVNILAPKIAGYLQVSTTVVKILPLIFLALAGLIVGKGDINLPVDGGGSPIYQVTFLAAIPPVAFAFDGWIAATSISKELKNEKRDLSLALVIAPIFILGLYLLYFVGISKFVGVDRIIELGDNHVYVAAETLLGSVGARIVIIFVLISVIGTCNGLVLAHTRMPYALAEKDMIFFAKRFISKSKKFDAPVMSALFSFGLAMLWTVAHYVTQRYNIMGGSDVSEIAIVAQYAMFIPLYIQVFKLWRKREIGVFKGIISPSLAIFGSIFSFISGFVNPLFILNLIIVAAVVISAYLFEKHHKKTIIDQGTDDILPMFTVSASDGLDIAIDIIEDDNESDEDNGENF